MRIIQNIKNPQNLQPRFPEIKRELVSSGSYRKPIYNKIFEIKMQVILKIEAFFCFLVGQPRNIHI